MLEDTPFYQQPESAIPVYDSSQVDSVLKTMDIIHTYAQKLANIKPISSTYDGFSGHIIYPLVRDEASSLYVCENSFEWNTGVLNRIRVVTADKDLRKIEKFAFMSVGLNKWEGRGGSRKVEGNKVIYLPYSPEVLPTFTEQHLDTYFKLLFH